MAGKNKKAKSQVKTTQKVGSPAGDKVDDKLAETPLSVTSNANVTESAEPAKAEGKKVKKAKADKPKKISALDAAAKVLAEAGKAMNTKELIDAMTAKKYWSSPNGLTPHATLYAAMAREINTKGAQARFKKADKGQFALA